jgi:iron complex outermembrane recepter protein
MKYIYVFLLFAVSLVANAQDNAPSIKGILKDQNGESAPFVAVVLLNKDSVIVKTDVAKENGSFSFLNVKDGEYRIATSSVQFRPFLSPRFSYVANTSHDMGEMALAASVQQLKEVQITAAKQMVEIHPDKTVFNVQGTINSAGNDGMDLLSKAPGIMVDNNDNLIVMGKSGVLIYIDGKRVQLRGDDLTAMLRSMRSENIEAIEVITNPSAKYDAEGNAGIINIKLKRDANLGLNGSVVLGGSRDIQNRYNAGLTLNNRSRKTNVFGSYSFYDNTGENHFDLDKKLNGFLLQNKSRDVWHNVGNDIRIGADYFINKQHTIGVLATGSIIDRENKTRARTPIVDFSGATDPQVLVARNTQEFETDNKNINLNYQFTGKKSTLNIDADYGLYNNISDNYQPNIYYDEMEETEISRNANRNDRDTEINIQTLKADYEVTVGKGKIGTGFKLSSVNSQNTLLFFNEQSGEFVLDPTRSNSFRYTENITAFYANYNRKFGEKTSLNAGVRSENTHSLGELLTETNTEDDRVERRYHNLFPSVGLTYELDKKNKLGLSYSKRVDRPNYQNLNPFEFKLDELTFMRGNPFLKPQYTDNYQLTYSWNSKLNMMFSYSVTRDFFAQVMQSSGEKGSLMITKNLADGENIAGNISYPFDITDWWNIRGNLNVYYAAYDAYLDGVNFNLDVVAYNASFQSTITMPKEFKLECSAWYNSPSIWRGTIKTDAMWSSTIGIRKGLFKNGQLSATVNDIFNTQRWYMHSDFGGMQVDGTGRFGFRRFIVGFNYRFGNQKVKGARNRKSGLEEEKSRLGEN